MAESSDYKTLRKNLVRWQDRIDRIENIVGTGIPDVNFCSMGHECWMELKSPKEPKRMTTSLFGSNHKVSQDQKNWFLRQRNCLGRAYLLIATDKRWMLISSKDVDAINEMSLSEVIQRALWCAMKPAKEEEWSALHNILTRSN